MNQTFKISNGMEKRNTLLLITCIVFVFCAIYISTDSLIRQTSNNGNITSVDKEDGLENKESAQSEILKETIAMVSIGQGIKEM